MYMLLAYWPHSTPFSLTLGDHTFKTSDLIRLDIGYGWFQSAARASLALLAVCGYFYDRLQLNT